MEIDLVLKLQPWHHCGGAESAADPFRTGGSGHDDHSCGPCRSAVHSCQADQRPVCHHQVAVCAMSTSVSILGAAVVFAAAQLLLRKDSPSYAFLLSIGAAVFILLRLGAAAARSDAGSMGTQPPGGWYCLFLSAALCRDPADYGLRPDTV